MKKNLLILGLLVAILIDIPLTVSRANKHTAKLSKSVSRTWIFGCESKGHKDAGAYPETKYADYTTCYAKKERHLRSYPNHDCGCR